MNSFNHEVIEFTREKIEFDNGFQLYTLPFEQGSLALV